MNKSAAYGRVTNIVSEKALNDLLQTHDRVVIKYSATWCQPCKKIEPEYARLAGLYRNVLFFHIDIDECDSFELVKTIQSVPTFHMFLRAKKTNDSITGTDKNKLEYAIAKLASS